jgi:hypothetical protein
MSGTQRAALGTERVGKSSAHRCQAFNHMLQAVAKPNALLKAACVNGFPSGIIR